MTTKNPEPSRFSKYHFPWTEAEDAVIKEHYGMGKLSATAIGKLIAQIPGTPPRGRMAVIGRAARLKLHNRDGAPATRWPGRKRSEKKAPPAAPKSVELTKEFEADGVVATDKAIPRVKGFPGVPVEEISSRHQCRAPLGPHMDRATLFCGAPTAEGSSYCRAHHVRFWMPAPKKQKAAA